MNKLIKNEAHSYLCVLGKVCGAGFLIGLITTQLNLSTKASVPAGKLDESHKQRFSDKICPTFRQF